METIFYDFTARPSSGVPYNGEPIVLLFPGQSTHEKVTRYFAKQEHTTAETREILEDAILQRERAIVANKAATGVLLPLTCTRIPLSDLVGGVA